ncbi:retrovirus-related pol polyprotein from transposon TNT 1-94 [Tanacetum coccineum]
MRVETINGKCYILIIVDNYSVEAARTILTFSKLSLDLWAEAIATACFTQNRPLVQTCFSKTRYELVNNLKPDRKYLRVCLCCLLNDRDDLGRLKQNGDIGVFINYSTHSQAFKIYNKRTRKIIETIHVRFDEITTMACEYLSSRPDPNPLTYEHNSLGLVPTPAQSTPSTDIPSTSDWNNLFEAMYDIIPGRNTSIISKTNSAATLITQDTPTTSHSSVPTTTSKTDEHDAPSPNISTKSQTEPITHDNVDEQHEHEQDRSLRAMPCFLNK